MPVCGEDGAGGVAVWCWRWFCSSFWSWFCSSLGTPRGGSVARVALLVAETFFLPVLPALTSLAEFAAAMALVKLRLPDALTGGFRSVSAGVPLLLLRGARNGVDAAVVTTVRLGLVLLLALMLKLYHVTCARVRSPRSSATRSVRSCQGARLTDRAQDKTHRSLLP